MSEEYEILMDSEEYKSRFIAHMINNGIISGLAIDEYESNIENLKGIYGPKSNPESDAGECLSYWEE